MQPGAFPGRFGADRGEVVGFDVAADGGGAVAGGLVGSSGSRV